MVLSYALDLLTVSCEGVKFSYHSKLFSQLVSYSQICLLRAEGKGAKVVHKDADVN